MYLKRIGKLLTSKSGGTEPSSYEKRIYRAAVSQRLRHTGINKTNFLLITTPWIRQTLFTTPAHLTGNPLPTPDVANYTTTLLVVCNIEAKKKYLERLQLSRLSCFRSFIMFWGVSWQFVSQSHGAICRFHSSLLMEWLNLQRGSDMLCSETSTTNHQTTPRKV
jgi:hypothetical protein